MRTRTRVDGKMCVSLYNCIILLCLRATYTRYIIVVCNMYLGIYAADTCNVEYCSRIIGACSLTDGDRKFRMSNNCNCTWRPVIIVVVCGMVIAVIVVTGWTYTSRIVRDRTSYYHYYCSLEKCTARGKKTTRI